MIPISLTKRLTCATCLRAKSMCICQWITPTVHKVEVVILQHPQEVTNVKGSARLLHLSLPLSRLVAGEVFDPLSLQELLTTPRPTSSVIPKHTILLYPDLPHDMVPGVAPPPVLTQGWLQDTSQLRLIVIDGTWRKSRKILYKNPLLQAIPRLSLRDMPASQYLIRKAHRTDQLSTLEATCAALMQLEGNVAQFMPLLAAFDGFVAQLSRRLPG